MSEWRECMLGEISTDISYGYTASAIQEECGPKFLRITDIVPDRINWSTVPYCSITDDKKAKYNLEHGDIVIARTGATTGYNKLITKNENAVFASYLIRYRINSEIANPYYVAYNLQSYEWDGFVEGIISGSAQPGANAKQLASFNFLLPPLPEQKAIAEVLSALDDKIDLLHRQNKTLEELAQTLFRQWFIEEADEEWEEIQIGELTSVVDNRGKTPPNQHSKTPYPLIEVNALNKANRLVDYSVIKKYVDKEIFNFFFRKTLNKYDVLVSTVGSIGEFSMFIIQRGNIAQNIIALHPKSISPFYLYQILKYKKDEIIQFDIGGVQPSIKVPHLLSMRISVPDGEIQNKFDNQIVKFVDKMEVNYNQIETLEKMRDTLLPKLMSGEVRVKM